ncbi:terpene synthase family protein [Nonomuraea rubra]|uniref:terpene synthase family protein n=1 Tax=Nonomuraea rubra TaxID=46180 RepID=UPI003CD0B87B
MHPGRVRDRGRGHRLPRVPALRADRAFGYHGWRAGRSPSSTRPRRRCSRQWLTWLLSPWTRAGRVGSRRPAGDSSTARCRRQGTSLPSAGDGGLRRPVCSVTSVRTRATSGGPGSRSAAAAPSTTPAGPRRENHGRRGGCRRWRSTRRCAGARSASYLYDLVELAACGWRCPVWGAEYGRTTWRQLVDACSDVTAWCNDVASRPKERGDVHNFVVLAMRQLAGRAGGDGLGAGTGSPRACQDMRKAAQALPLDDLAPRRPGTSARSPAASPAAPRAAPGLAPGVPAATRDLRTRPGVATLGTAAASGVGLGAAASMRRPGLRRLDDLLAEPHADAASPPPLSTDRDAG